jgi:toxin-antitoxin system PIN domain toxin
MPVSGVIKLVDANVWLALAFSDHLHHARAKEWFDAQVEDSCAFCRVTQMALLRHLTNAKVMGTFVQSQRQAWENFDKLTADPRVCFADEPAGLMEKFREFTRSDTPAHALWTDAYLAAFACGRGAQMVTFDQGFKRFAGLALLTIGVQAERP